MALEKQGWEPEVGGLGGYPSAADNGNRCLRWWGRWRMIEAPQMARDLIAAGWQPGPAIGEGVAPAAPCSSGPYR